MKHDSAAQPEIQVTRKMVQAGLKELLEYSPETEIEADFVTRLYRAMRATAPAAPDAAEEGVILTDAMIKAGGELIYRRHAEAGEMRDYFYWTAEEAFMAMMEARDDELSSSKNSACDQVVVASDPG